MRLLASILALAARGAAGAQDVLPPPPPPPSSEPTPLPPPPAPGERARRAELGRPLARRARLPRRPGTIGEAPVAPAGSQAAPLHPDEAVLALALRARDRRHREVRRDAALEHAREPRASCSTSAGRRTASGPRATARRRGFRVRMFTGGENEIYIPSDGDVEAAYMIGRREFRFVIGRLEVGRYPALGVEALAQLATLPVLRGVALARRRHDAALLLPSRRSRRRGSTTTAARTSTHSAAVADRVRPAAAASDAARLRYTVLLPPSMLLSLQGDLVKMWQKPDLLLVGRGEPRLPGARAVGRLQRRRALEQLHAARAGAPDTSRERVRGAAARRWRASSSDRRRRRRRRAPACRRARVRLVATPALPATSPWSRTEECSRHESTSAGSSRSSSASPSGGSRTVPRRTALRARPPPTAAAPGAAAARAPDRGSEGGLPRPGGRLAGEGPGRRARHDRRVLRLRVPLLQARRPRR